jgi:hypothetical protein
MSVQHNPVNSCLSSWSLSSNLITMLCTKLPLYSCDFNRIRIRIWISQAADSQSLQWGRDVFANEIFQRELQSNRSHLDLEKSVSILLEAWSLLCGMGGKYLTSNTIVDGYSCLATRIAKFGSPYWKCGSCIGWSSFDSSPSLCLVDIIQIHPNNSSDFAIGTLNVALGQLWQIQLSLRPCYFYH